MRLYLFTYLGMLRSVGSIVAPHHQANVRAGGSTTFKFFMI